MKIRKFQKKDAEQCSKIICDILEKGSKNLSKKIKEKIKKGASPEELIKKSKTRKYFICEKNKRIIAMGGLKKNEVIRMYTSLENQGKGIGSKILKKIEEEAKKKSIIKLCLYTYPKALNFYIKNEFKIIKKFNREADSIYMEKELK